MGRPARRNCGIRSDARRAEGDRGARGPGDAADEGVHASGRLAAWRPPGSAHDLARRGLAALADPGVRRIAMANPALAPWSRAAEAALRAAGGQRAVEEKLVSGRVRARAELARAFRRVLATEPARAVLSRSGRVLPE